MDRFEPGTVRAAVNADIDRLFAPWAAGRPPNWAPDPTTRNLVSLGYWLDEQLRALDCNEPDRKTQLAKFNRLSRTYDIWEVAAECLNDVLDGAVEQGRVPHRRWG